jgi:hypothetical protein
MGEDRTEAQCVQEPQLGILSKIGGAIGTGKSLDPITERLRMGAIDSLNAYLIRLLEKKTFWEAGRIHEALKKLV